MTVSGNLSGLQGEGVAGSDGEWKRLGDGFNAGIICIGLIREMAAAGHFIICCA